MPALVSYLDICSTKPSHQHFKELLVFVEQWLADGMLPALKYRSSHKQAALLACLS